MQESGITRSRAKEGHSRRKGESEPRSSTESVPIEEEGRKRLIDRFGGGRITKKCERSPSKKRSVKSVL